MSVVEPTKSAVVFFTAVLVVFACAKKSPEPSDPQLPPEVEKTLREQYSTLAENWPKPTLDDGVEHRELGELLAGPSVESLGVEKVALGKLLFFDSYVGAEARGCSNTCHIAKKYWTDQLKLAPTGVTRNTPTMENAWYLNGNLFHDGRAKTYAEQIETAITSPVEMNQPMAALPAKLAASGFYQPHFKKAYGDEELNRERILDAIAAYSQTIVSGETKFDRFVKGDYAALDDRELNGLHLFRTKARCVNCHNGPYFTDLKFHNLGYAGLSSSLLLDSGRYDATGLKEDIGKFRTLGLRNVANTAPYFHNGAFASLKALIDEKDKGMPRGNGYTRLGTLDPLIKPLGLTDEEKEDIIAFLHALSSPPIVPTDIQDFSSQVSGN